MASTSEETSKEVYAYAGLALYWSQCFEASMSNFLVLFARLSGQAVTVEELEALESDAEKKTMGQLMRKIKELVTLEGDAEPVLTEALQTRNAIAHRFFKTHGETFLSEDGALSMVKELKDAVSLLQEADHIADTMCVTTAKACGISMVDVQREYQSLLEAAERR